MTAEQPQSHVWLSLGLALVGGYADAAGFLLAQTFTGHVTGNLVLTAISVARTDWPTFSRRLLAIALFLAGIPAASSWNGALRVGGPGLSSPHNGHGDRADLDGLRRAHL